MLSKTMAKNTKIKPPSLGLQLVIIFIMNDTIFRKPQAMFSIIQSIIWSIMYQKIVKNSRIIFPDPLWMSSITLSDQ